jgi:hypothetical protein
MPVDEANLRQIIQEVNDWGTTIEATYGSLDANSEHEHGLLSLFARHEGKAVLLHLGSPRHSPPSFEARIYYVSASTSLERAADVLGDPPDHLHDSFARFRPFAWGSSTLDELAVPRGTRPMRVSVETWAEARQIIRQRRQIVVSKALGLVAWVQDRVSALRNAALPTIIGLGPEPRNRHRIQVLLAGTTREVIVTRTHATFLKQLATDGHASCDRSSKRDLVTEVPELAPWVQGTRKAGMATDSADYGIPDELRERIQM